ncbi:hypothetical protein [Sinorhizobium meliloti]|uniref:hypothetical protein n=1 Tax=Rhizobium meliloti TaxID=382 RepID=UPI001F184ABD|nr:hypothetical protein [Sinorhizobium meliloti]
MVHDTFEIILPPVLGIIQGMMQHDDYHIATNTDPPVRSILDDGRMMNLDHRGLHVHIRVDALGYALIDQTAQLGMHRKGSPEQRTFDGKKPRPQAGSRRGHDFGSEGGGSTTFKAGVGDKDDIQVQAHQSSATNLGVAEMKASTFCP